MSISTWMIIHFLLFFSQSFFPNTSFAPLWVVMFVILLMLVLSFSFVWFQFLIFICAAPLWTVNSRLLQILFIKNIPWKSIVNFSFRLWNISEEDFDLLFHLFPKCMGIVCSKFVWKITDKGIINISCNWRVKTQRSMRLSLFLLQTKIGNFEGESEKRWNGKSCK